jgi:AraC-like DNA-binding protein
MEAALASSLGAGAFDLPHGSAGFYVRANYVRLQSVGLAYCNYRIGAHLEFSNVRNVRQLICLSGVGKANVNGKEVSLSPQASCIASEDKFAADYFFDYEQLVLEVDAGELTQKLATILGFQPKGTPRFEVAANFERPEMQSFRRLVMFFVNELEFAGANLPKQLLAELEQALIISFLSCNRHDFTEQLGKPTAKVAPWQVRLVEEYIEANWDQAISVEGLSGATGASVRSIFNTFRTCRGYSPMAFLKQVRLRHANEMLTLSDAETSVTAVALACCFLNVGHFARDYRAAFGELPSETLNHARRAPILAPAEASPERAKRHWVS